MGWNTVAFILNDHAHELEKSPKTVTWMLSNPPILCGEEAYLRRMVSSVAREAGEPEPHYQALRVLPSFHASNRVFLMAGGNTIHDCKVVKYRKSKGKKFVTLELPDWA